MNVNGLSANKNLIDSAGAAKLSESLFQALEKKSVDYSKVNLARFNRPTVGVDLYSGKTDVNLQRQISMTSSGAFQTMELTSVQTLNSLAAQALYSNTVAEKVGGKMTVDSSYVNFEPISEAKNTSLDINVFQTNKDKKDSNPFSFDTSTTNAGKKEA